MNLILVDELAVILFHSLYYFSEYGLGQGN